MILIKDILCTDADVAITHFEPMIRRLTNTFISTSSEKDDCRQDLRIKVWKLFENPDRTFNEGYIARRLKFDLINFINRDHGYNWSKKFSSIESFDEQELDYLIAGMSESQPQDIEKDILIEEILEHGQELLSEKQYESLILFMSGAPIDMVRCFLGTRSRNMTRFYLLLAESFTILKEVMDEKPGIKRDTSF